MDDLAAFLNARLDEDEAGAREAAADPGMAAEWHETTSGCLDVGLPDHGGEPWQDYVWPQGDSRVTRFIASHDPARVLREVEAKRRILADVKALIDGMDAESNQERGPDHYYTPTGESDLLLELLALPYSDHPDYRPEWKP